MNNPQGLDHARKLIKENLESKDPFLDLGNCGLRVLIELPELWECQHLEGLNMGSWYWKEGNEINSKNKYQPNQIGDNGTKELVLNLPTLKSLNLSYNKISNDGAKAIAENCKTLNSLFLFYNNISDEGAKVIAENCKFLTYLNLSSNKIGIESAKAIARNCKILTGLNLSDNNFGDEGTQIIAKNCKSLIFIDLSSSKMTDAGAINIIKNCKALNSLNLAFNSIGNNGLKYIAENSYSINFLDISNNQITDISPLVPLLNNENIFISFQENPISNPPKEIVTNGISSILEYFKQKEITGSSLFLEAKLVLLGDGRAGKTSLAYRLLGKDLPKEADRTQGVEINVGSYYFNVKEGRFKLNIWDFAGQDKYKPLHQFFYSGSNLYVLVADSGNSLTDFGDWFETAELFGEGSPLVVVLNEFRDGLGYGIFDEDKWRSQFPKLIRQVHLVNLLNQKGFTTLEKDIQHLAYQLPHVQNEFPENWSKIRFELESRRDENYISLQEYLKICQENNLHERTSALILSSIFHKIGVCLHYQKSVILQKYVILKNEWATSAFYKIFEDDVIAEVKKGFFNLDDLQRLWSDDIYKGMIPLLLELLCEFKMAYPLFNRNEYIFPALLPHKAPTDYFFHHESITTILVEYDFLPKSLFTQYIVYLHEDIDKDRTLVWRNGVVLRWGNETVAEITTIESRNKKALQVLVTGPEKKSISTYIISTLRKLNGEYKGIRVREVIPCPCQGCQNKKNKQHYYDFNNLLFRLEKGRQNVECDNSLEEVDISKYLENLLFFDKLNVGEKHILKDDFTAYRLIQDNLKTKNTFLDLGNCGLENLSDFNALWECTHLIELNIGKYYWQNGIKITSKNALKANRIENKDIHLISVKLLNLTALYLSDNNVGIEGIISLSENKKIVNLDMSRNTIRDQGAKVIAENFKDLKLLCLSGCHIGDDGVNIIVKSCKNLITLDLSYNLIKSFSIEFTVRNLKYLKYLNFNENQQEDIPSEILNNHLALKEYFGVSFKNKNTIEIKLIPNNTIKMLLLGNSTSGKTTLVKYLLTKEFVKNHDSTHGVQCWIWEPVIDGQKYKVNINDFGGQDYFHATHSLFLDVESLFILLHNNSSVHNSDCKEDDQFYSTDYWLGNISDVLQDKPSNLKNVKNNYAIWYVQNKTDHLSYQKEWLEKGSQSLETSIEHQFFISIKSASENQVNLPIEWRHFFEKLLERVVTLSTTDIPEWWAAIRDLSLPEWRNEKLYLTRDEFSVQCKTFLTDRDIPYVTENESFAGILTYLKNSGEVVWFEDKAELSNYIFTGADTLTRHLFTNIMDKNVKNNGGVINLSKDKKDMEIYIHVLQSYGLVFEKEPRVYIAPQFLPEEPHIERFMHLLPLSFAVRFNSYMPRYLITRLISYFAQQDKAAHYWRFGVMFKKSGLFCLIKVDFNKQIINVHVEDKKEKFDILFETYLMIMGKGRLNELVDKVKGVTKQESFNVALAETLKIEKNEKQMEFSLNGVDFAPFTLWKSAMNSRAQFVQSNDNKYLPLSAIVYKLLGGYQIMPKRIFLSYSHEDWIHLEDLKNHLSSLERSGRIVPWYDGKILAGQSWDDTLKKELREADIVLALLSKNFMASQYIWETELPIAAKAGAVIIPIFLSPVYYQDNVINIHKKQGLPAEEKWILGSSWQNKDEAWLEVVKGIVEVLEEGKKI